MVKSAPILSQFIQPPYWVVRLHTLYCLWHDKHINIKVTILTYVHRDLVKNIGSRYIACIGHTHKVMTDASLQGWNLLCGIWCSSASGFKHLLAKLMKLWLYHQKTNIKSQMSKGKCQNQIMSVHNIFDYPKCILPCLTT